MGRDRRSRPSPSGCPRRGTQALRYARRGKGRPRHVQAPHMPMPRVSTNAKPTAGRASRVRYRGFSSANRTAPCRGARSRARPAAPPRTVRRLRVPLRHARRCGRKALPAAPPRHVKRRAPGRDIASSAPGHLNRARRLGRAALQRSAAEHIRSWARFVSAELLNQRRFICIPSFWLLSARSS